MRAISLSTEPLAVSYALRQLVETGELAVFNSGDKAAVLIPLDKYQALMDVLHWLEAPPQRAGKTRARKSAAPGKRLAAPQPSRSRAPKKPTEPARVTDLLSLLEGH